MSKQKKRQPDNPFADMPFDEALERLTRTRPGELADAITRGLVDEMNQTRERIRLTREEIGRGARTRGKKDRFRL